MLLAQPLDLYLYDVMTGRLFLIKWPVSAYLSFYDCLFLNPPLLPHLVLSNTWSRVCARIFVFCCPPPTSPLRIKQLLSVLCESLTGVSSAASRQWCCWHGVCVLLFVNFAWVCRNVCMTNWDRMDVRRCVFFLRVTVRLIRFWCPWRSGESFGSLCSAVWLIIQPSRFIRFLSFRV